MKRNTVQRQIISETLNKFITHPTVDELYSEIIKSHPSISKTTVYRNLRQLAQGSQIGRVALPDDVERYDKRTDQHYHFQCKSCGELLDVDIDYLDGINEKAQEKHGFQVDEHDIVFKGICLNCKENQ